jgi:hypothetical protein
MAIDPRLVEIALEYVEGTAFERFFQAFFPEFGGASFVPLGGAHDGGADAFDGSTIFEGKSKATSFYQASVEHNHRAKIRRTVARLRDFGREVRVLTYFSSRNIQTQDVDEEELTEELDVSIRIRSRKWIAVNINKSSATQQAFEHFLRPCVAFLHDVGAARLIERPPISGSTSVCVFLGQEVERRRSNSDLLTSIVDSLVLWSLSGTDPDKGIFMTRDQILAKIEETLPTAKQFMRGSLDHRLEALASKQKTGGREIRWHRKQGLFCLPFETRILIESENLEDETLRMDVLEIFSARASKYAEEEDVPIAAEQVADLAMTSVQRVFEKEGLRFAAFFSDSEGEIGGSVADRVDEVLNDAQMGGNAAIAVKAAIIAVLRPAFYQSEEQERQYFGKLSRTYALLFSLRADPEIINYFRGMSSNFVLYVGADILIQALSERYLRPEDQMAVNTLGILRDAGSTLILSEPALEEVRGHLVATDAEFRSLFMHVEPYVKKEHARHASKPLVRAYFYSMLAPIDNIRPPGGWKSFIGQFCDYDQLRGAEGKTQLKHYLLERFRMEFESHDDLAALADDDEVAKLAGRLKKIKRDEVLAINDARQILAIYGKRAQLKEQHKPNPFGYRTWWLTHESFVRQFTGELVHREGAPYILRPEFILNFIALSPTTEQVRSAYRSIFPTILGMTLSNRMRDEIFKDVMQKVRDIQEKDEARLTVIMGTLANRLKSDTFKIYETRFGRGILD